MGVTIVKGGRLGPSWVKLKRYCELSGDTPDAVHAKRKKGIWVDGTQCAIAPDHKLWINLPEVEKWVQSSIKSTH